METWKPILGYEDCYEVSNLGRVRSIDRLVNSRYGKYRKVKGMILKPRPDKDGYLSVNLKMNQRGHTARIHRLVCSAFHENNENKPQVNHINGVKFDNRSINLEWATLSENRVHAYETGLQNGLNRRGQKNNFNKLSEVEVRKIRSMYSCDLRGVKDKKGKKTIKEIAMMFDVTYSCVQKIIKGETWSWLKWN